ncbi:MAG: hypothetical protein JO314_01630 [Acidobacteria bacterium]|nr:hypothetical protein [Acidobacteriota bacterium]
MTTCAFRPVYVLFVVTLGSSLSLGQETRRATTIGTGSGPPAPSDNDRSALPPTKPGAGKRLATSREDRERFANLLKLPGAGIIKLLKNSCENATSAYVTSADPACNEVVGGGGQISFRTRGYSIAPLADLKIREGYFIAGGQYTQGAMVDLGEMAVDKVTAAVPGVDLIAQYEPPTTLSQVRQETAALNEGRQWKGLVIGATAPISPGHTYALRSMAYKVDALKADDKRADILVVFNVIRLDDNGDVTLVWRELQRKDAPHIDLTK